MLLEAVNIKRFRSIESVSLKDCGGLNVLIGRNNSGKSNILASIYTSFNFIRGAGIINPDYPPPRQIDFFKHTVSRTIELSLVFFVTEAEHDLFVQDIITEAPQMKNAIEGLDPALRLTVTLTLTTTPHPFGYISRIALGGTERTRGARIDQEHSLLKVSVDSASELFANEIKYRTGVEHVESMRSIAERVDEEVWKRMQKENDPNMFYRYLARYGDQPSGFPPSPEVWGTTRRLIAESQSLLDFHRGVQAFVSTEYADAQAARKKALRYKIDTFSGEESAVPSYVGNLLKRIGLHKVHYLTDRRAPIGREEAERLLTLKKRRRGPEQLVKIQGTVSDLLGVKIDAFEPDDPSQSRERQPERPAAELDVDDFLVEVNGAGIREALRLILDVEFGLPNIVLVEEPELHLHPALETSIMRYLKGISTKCQVFLTTHSTNFLDTAEMRNVYLVSRKESTSVQLIDIEEAEAILPQELGLRLSSLFMFDRLVFVESGTDESIFREWASKIGINFGQANVGFVPMGGARFLSYFAAEETLAFLTKRQVKIWILIDRDEKDVMDVESLQKTFGGNACIKVLGRRELENYLALPRPIIEFIKLKYKVSGKFTPERLPDEDEIGRALQEEADKLKSFVLQKRIQKHMSKPIYPRFALDENCSSQENISVTVESELQRQADALVEAKGRVEEVYQREQEAVNASWERQKLDIVPGDLLLDQVCQRYGVRFKKERDGLRLAALLSPAEISHEIRSLIEEIGR